MTKNDQPMPKRAAYRAQQQRKGLFSKIFKRKNKKSASDQTDDDFLVFNEDGENSPEVQPELTTEEKIKVLKKKLNIGIITVFLLLVIVILVLFFVK